MTWAFLARCGPLRCDGELGRMRTVADISGNGHGDVVPPGRITRVRRAVLGWWSSSVRPRPRIKVRSGRSMRVCECPYVQAAGSVDGVKTPSDAQVLQPGLQPAREFGGGLRCVALTLCQARKRRTRRTRNSAPPASGRTPSSRPDRPSASSAAALARGPARQNHPRPGDSRRIRCMKMLNILLLRPEPGENRQRCHSRKP
jgi:hypothetical protein